MLAVERRKLFFNIITANGNATVAKLAESAKVTEETVRRDLHILAQDGYITKTHGGAILNDTAVDVASDLRQNINFAEKTAIAKCAAKLIKKNDTVFLDTSTTCFFLAREIKRFSDITVVTNSLQVMNEIASNHDIRIICIGGQFVPKNQSFIGGITQAFIAKNYYFNKVFFSCRGLAESGFLLESDEQEAAIKREVLECSDERILLVDHTKFGRFGSIKLCETNQVSVMITDQEVSAEVGGKLENIIFAKKQD